MKKIKIVLGCLAVSLALGLSFTGSGCKAGKGQYNPTTGIYNAELEGDPFVVNAQRTRGVALEVFDGFMKIERQNEADLLRINPAIHAAAEEIRRHGKLWLTDLSAAITAYQSNRTEGNKVNLNQALAVVSSAVTSAQNYMAIIAKEKRNR